MAHPTSFLTIDDKGHRTASIGLWSEKTGAVLVAHFPSSRHCTVLAVHQNAKVEALQRDAACLRGVVYGGRGVFK